MQNCSKRWTALYLPALPEDAEDPSADFASEEEAWAHVFANMCRACADERERALGGDEEADSHPACACEWLVVETAKLDECEDLGDVLEAAGFVRILPPSEKTE